MLSSPAFGQADLSNCERELIHLAGSVQPHGVLLAVHESTLRIVQVSANVQALLGEARQSYAHRDERLLGMVLDNLLRNAWKFTRQRKDARIEFGFTAENVVAVLEGRSPVERSVFR